MHVFRTFEAFEHLETTGKKLGYELESLLQDVFQEQNPTILFLQGVWPCETSLVAQQIHKTATIQFPRQDAGELNEIDADVLLNQFQTHNQASLHLPSKGTLWIKQLELLPHSFRIELLEHCLEVKQRYPNPLRLLFMQPKDECSFVDCRTLQELGLVTLSVPPLFKRGTDIDKLLCHFIKQLQQKSPKELKGLSLEATAQIHRAVQQTRRHSQDLYLFLRTAIKKATHERLPLEDGYIVAWSTIRLLEDLWGYSIHHHEEQHPELSPPDFQETLRSIALERAAQQSGYSRKLLEMFQDVLQQMLCELPPHQRNYQGFASCFDQLNWTSIKLLSKARTQAEMRKFFGLGNKGQIPKATVKLKFDQYHLDEYGFQLCDHHQAPLDPFEGLHVPCSSNSPNALSAKTHRQLPNKTVSIQSCPTSNRSVMYLEGNAEQTLLRRYQGLLTILAAEPLTLHQLSTLMQCCEKSLKSVLDELLIHALIVETEGRYHIRSDDLYIKHPLHKSGFITENIENCLTHAFGKPQGSLLDNFFLRLDEKGLPHLRQHFIDPFLYERFLPLSNQPHRVDHEEGNGIYQKQMYTLLFIGTGRISSQIRMRTPLQQRIQHYFQETCLQRLSEKQHKRSLFLQVNQMLSPKQAKKATQEMTLFRDELKSDFAQGRGNKSNFNITLCFTPVPPSFYHL